MSRQVADFVDFVLKQNGLELCEGESTVILNCLLNLQVKTDKSVLVLLVQ